MYRRRSIRLQGDDYSSEAGYFVKILIDERACLFGEVVDEKMRLSSIGKIAEGCWLDIPRHFPNAALDDYVIMPNHIHGIITLKEDLSSKGLNVLGKDHPRKGLINQTPTRKEVEAPAGKGDWILMKNPKPTLGKIVRHFKARTAKFIHDAGVPEFRWQRNYHEHIIRD